MAQNYFYPPSGGTANASVGTTGTTAPTSATEIAGVTPGGALVPVQVSPSGVVAVSIASGGIANPLPTTDAADGPASPGTASTVSIQTGGQFNAVLPTLASGQQAATQLDSSGRLILSPTTTIPISAASLPLPTGASTSALQTSGNSTLSAISGQLPTTLGAHTTAGSLAVNIASDQTVPVSLASSPLPTGAATSALQVSGNSTLSTISSQLPTTLGAHVTSASVAVNIASDQTVPVSLASSPLPTGAATAANQTNASQKTQIVDGSGNVIASTSNALDAYITNFPATQPVSGTVAVTQSTSPWVDNISQFGGSAVVTGTGASGAGIPRVTVSSDSSLTNITGTISLPTGAATSANQATEISSLSTIASNQTSGSQKSQIATPTALTVHQAGISVGTTAVRLTTSGSAPASTRVTLVANVDSAVTAKFYIGSSTVTNSGSTIGIELVAGQTFIANNDAGDYWIISNTAGQTVYVMEQY